MTASQTYDNQEALLEIIRNAPETSKMPRIEAELLRQLQRFDDALAIVYSPSFADDNLATIISTNAQLKNTKVCEVSSWSIVD
uniref:Uncharacterized protein n=1 Tax=Dechloromonas aromatica (strain RCB) TaxID=159087 RepID=Q47FC1_DECAR